MQKIEFYFDKFLSQKIEKEIKYLFKGYLTYLEELLNSGKISENEYNKKRKEILDNGNGAIRNIQEQISSVFENIKIVN